MTRKLEENVNQLNNLNPVQVNEIQEVDMDQEDKARSEATFRYTVENFSKLRYAQQPLPYYVRNLPWKISVLPRTSRTNKRQLQRYIACYLECNGMSELSAWTGCYVDAELRLLSNKEGQEAFSQKIQGAFYTVGHLEGFEHFITLQDILNVEKGYIKNDSITFEVHIVAGELQDFIQPGIHTKEPVTANTGEKKVEKNTTVVENGVKQKGNDTEELPETYFEKLAKNLEKKEAQRKEMENKFFEETNKNIQRVELSMGQWKREVVEEIEGLRKELSEEKEFLNTYFDKLTEDLEKKEADREERRRVEGEKTENRIFEQTHKDIKRVELSMGDWKQEVIEKIEGLRKDMKEENERKESKIGRVVEYVERMVKKKKKEEGERRQKDEEISKLRKTWEEKEKVGQKKDMIITGLGFLVIFLILNSCIFWR